MLEEIEILKADKILLNEGSGMWNVTLIFTKWPEYLSSKEEWEFKFYKHFLN